MKHIMLTLSVMIGTCHPVYAENNKDLISYLKAITPNLINFIEENSSYEYDGWTYPDIIVETEKQICSVIYDDPSNISCDVAGYYNDQTNIIHIRNGPTEHMSDDRFFEVVLVHELVHFLQYHSGVYDTIACMQKLEVNAFEVQDKFVEKQGIDPTQAPDPLFSMLVSSCPNERLPTFDGGG